MNHNNEYVSILKELSQLLKWSQSLSRELSELLSQELSKSLEESLKESLLQAVAVSQSRLQLMKLSWGLERTRRQEQSQSQKLLGVWGRKLRRSLRRSWKLSESLKDLLEESQSLSQLQWLSESQLLSQWLKKSQCLEESQSQSQSLIQKWLDEFENSKQLENDLEQTNNSNATSYAVKLPYLILWLNQETQTWLIDMRIDWYGKPPLSRKTHIDVWLQTHKYLIFDHFLFRLWDKITFRSLYRSRIYRVKDSNK